MISEPNHNRRLTFANFLNSDPGADESSNNNSDEETRTINNNKNNVDHRISNASATSSGLTSGEASPYQLSPWNQTYSPYNMTPWNQAQSPFYRSPWVFQPNDKFPADNSVLSKDNGLIGTMVRQEGNVYSLAAAGDLLFTGSDSKNIRVWKNLKDFSGFKSNSGLVKTIVLTEDNRIFTGHQDGKIRVWKSSRRNPSKYSRIGSLPTFKEFVTKAMNPKNYVEVRRHRNVLRIRHYDAVSCLSLNEELGLLYSCSWDKTLKIWRLSDSKFLESVEAHDDAINAVAAGFDGLVFTGSADGAVKVWKRELQGKSAKHVLVQILLKQENAVTALAVSLTDAVVYSGASDGSVNFWTREKGLSHGGVLRGHRLAVLCLEAAGSLIVSGGADKNICVWKRNADGVTHTCLSVFMDHEGPVKCLAAVEETDDAAEEDGGRSLEKMGQQWILYSGSLDKSVKVWRVTE